MGEDSGGGHGQAPHRVEGKNTIMSLLSYYQGEEDSGQRMRWQGAEPREREL